MKLLNISIKGEMSDLELAEYGALMARLRVICKLFKLQLEDYTEEK